MLAVADDDGGAAIEADENDGIGFDWIKPKSG